jgi:cytochrome c553
MIRKMALAALVAASFSATAAEQAAAAKADPAAGKTIAETVCVACHNADGNSVVPANPILAGQIEPYIYKQLTNFKMGADGSPAQRANPIMMGMAAGLSDDDMKNLAAWFSQQKQSPASAQDAKLAEEGKKLWRAGDFAKGVPACAGCHGASGHGLPAQYPRLAGQYAEYTETQLKAFRLEERANDPAKMMRTIAAKLSDAQIKAVAEYAAGLR